jgi:prevent-host-death family protein
MKHIGDARAVGLRVLKNRLSEYVRIAAAGETVLVTDRERVVAELVPPREGRAATAQDALLADAVWRGWLTPALGPTTKAIPGRTTVPLERLLDEVDRDRADR